MRRRRKMKRKERGMKGRKERSEGKAWENTDKS